MPSPNKNIAGKMDTKIRTVKNWFSGSNTPDSEHLVLLMRGSDAVLAAILNLADRSYLVPHISSRNDGQEIMSFPDCVKQATEIYRAESCTINVSVTPDDAGKLNQRQLWFLGLMQCGKRVQPDDIVTQWSVSIRTARTDIAGLMEIGLIRFVGSRKTGQYVLK